MVDLSIYLGSVLDDKAFKLTDGRLIHSLEELYSSMNYSGPEIFYTHVNDVTNDVANWVRTSLGYNEFADKLLTITDRDEFLKIMSEEISKLKTPVIVQVPQANIDKKIAAVESFMSETPPLSAPATTVAVSVPPVVSNAVPVVNLSVSSNPVSNSTPITPLPFNISSPSTPVPVVSPVVPTMTISSNPVSVASVAPVNITAPALIPSQVVSPAITISSAPPIVPTVSSSPSPISQNISAPFTSNSSAQVVSSPTLAPVSSSSVASSTPNLVVPSVSSTTSFIDIQKFDFEDIFNILLSELEQEVFVSE